MDNDAHLALDERDPYSLQTKPHGHGDVHALLHSSGLVDKWKQAGVQWICFFQDTNGLVFRGLPVALGECACRLQRTGWKACDSAQKVFPTMLLQASAKGPDTAQVSCPARLAGITCLTPLTHLQASVPKTAMTSTRCACRARLGRPLGASLAFAASAAGAA